MGNQRATGLIHSSEILVLFLKSFIQSNNHEHVRASEYSCSVGSLHFRHQYYLHLTTYIFLHILFAFTLVTLLELEKDTSAYSFN